MSKAAYLESVQNEKMQEMAKEICQTKLNNAMHLHDATVMSETQRQRELTANEVMHGLRKSCRVSASHLKGSGSSCLASLLFLFVLVGVELDFIGFVMAFPLYWAYDGENKDLVKLLLILMPLSYIYAAVRSWYSPPDDAELKHEAERTKNRNFKEAGKQGGRTQPKEGARPSARSAFAEVLGRVSTHEANASAGTWGRESTSTARIARHSPKVAWFHLIPGARLYLVVKNLKPEEVEVVFRMNSLSSFSLGVCQLACMAILVVLNGEPFGVIIMINATSQVINWVITFLYFLTSAADSIKAAITISAVQARIRDQHQAELVEYIMQVIQHASHMAFHSVPKATKISPPVPKDGPVNEVDTAKARLISEIETLTSVDVDHNKFTAGELFMFRSFLHRRMILHLSP